MKYFKYLKSVRNELKILFVTSFISIILSDFWLNKIPEFFNFGSEAGVIVNRLSYSFVSAFIFYFLVVHLKREREKETLYTYVAEKSRLILNHAKNLKEALYAKSGKDLDDVFPSADELDKILEKINPREKAPLILGRIDNHADWLGYLDYFKKKTTIPINSIFSKINFLDATLVHHLISIEDSLYFKELDFFISINAANDNFKGFGRMMSDYFGLIESFQEYFDKELVKYLNHKIV